jgi:hypothetical protein
MARPDDQSRRARRDAANELCGVDLILECERAASRRNPRDRDPKRWSKTAWRRYLLLGGTRTEPRRLRTALQQIVPTTH